MSIARSNYPEALELYRKRPSVKGDTIVLCEGAFDTAA